MPYDTVEFNIADIDFELEHIHNQLDSRDNGVKLSIGPDVVLYGKIDDFFDICKCLEQIEIYMEQEYERGRAVGYDSGYNDAKDEEEYEEKEKIYE